jgi:putative ABC transport system permease protein
MDTVLQDIRYGIRTLLKSPGFTIVALITIALGVGANTAIFSVVNSVLVHPLPYEAPDKLVKIHGYKVTTGNNHSWISGPDFIDYQSQNQSFETLSAYRTDFFNVTSGNEPEQVGGAYTSSSFFAMLGANAALGRTFLPEEDLPGANRVAVLSHGLWQRRFGGDKSILERSITIDNAKYVVVGIMPPEFRSVELKDQIWIPLILDGSDPERLPSPLTVKDIRNRKIRFITGYGRLKAGVTLDQARRDMHAIGEHLAEQYQATNKEWSTNTISLHEDVVGDIRPALLVLLGTVGFVLLIACANIANLLFARATGRRKEIAVRMALGAGRKRIVRQLLTESLLLSAAGGFLGFFLAYWGVDLLLAISSDNLPRKQDIHVDAMMFVFTALVSALTGLIFGIGPALQASKTALADSLKEGSKGSVAGFGGRGIRSILVISEVAFSLILLIGAALMIKSFLHLREINTGFRSENLLSMYVLPAQSQYPEGYQQIAYHKSVVSRVETLPGVESAATALYVPLSGSSPQFRFTIDGQPPLPPEEVQSASLNIVSPGYFKTMGIAMLDGRDFSERDAGGTPNVVIINETMARRFWPGENPIGKRLTTLFGEPASNEIVGVVKDIKHTKLTAESGPEVYLPFLQRPLPGMGLVVRTNVEPTSLVPAIRREIQVVDPDLPVSDVRSMGQIIGDMLSQPRFNASLLGIFAGLALVLATVGIYGVMAYSVSQRKREIGIRMALGAQQKDVLRLVVWQAMTLALIGVTLGLVVAYILTRVMTSLLYGVSATDPLVFAGIALLLILVELVASYFPARNATKVDPVLALRYE